MNKKIKISFVGVGFMSQIAHLINFKKLPNVELYEICDLDYALAKKIKKKFNFTGKIHKNYKEMTTKNVDGFVIILQRKLTANIAKYFIERNCNILTEKPHSYSFNEYNKIQKSQKKIWLKGYTRRSDDAVNYLKKNFLKINKQLGNLIRVIYNCSSGNSYLGAKHFVLPSIKKEIKSKVSKYPNFIKKKDYGLYDGYINTLTHFLDFFDFFDFKFMKIEHLNMQSNFLKFVATSLSPLKKKIPIEINLTASPNKFWDEKVTFFFENGQATIEFNPPIYKKNGHILKIFDKKKM